MKVSTLLSRALMGPAKVLRIDSCEQLPEALAASSGRRLLRLEVPMHLTATDGAFAYAGGWHPFVEAIRAGRGVLARFYERFQPKSLGEIYGLRDADGVEQLGPLQLPWLADRPRGDRGEKGLGPEHGNSLFGPCTVVKIDLEYDRLMGTLRSILARGYLPDWFGDITGHFLINGNDLRFLVKGGKHRAAALAAMGWTHLPVSFAPGWARTVRLESLARWPLVHTGRIAAPQARQVFERFFEHQADPGARPIPRPSRRCFAPAPQCKGLTGAPR